MNYIQEWLQIGKVNVPVISDEGGEKYYPISYISEKVLLRSGNAIIHKGNRDKFSDYLIKTLIEFSEKGEHVTNCISEKGLKLLLSKTQVGRLSAAQRKAQNDLHRLLGIDLLSEARLEIDYMSRDNLNRHDKYTREIIKYDIEETKLNGEKLTFRLCSKCNKYHPLTSKYYVVDSRVDKGFSKVCKVCARKVEQYTHMDIVADDIRKQGGDELYNSYKNNSIIPIFEAYRKRKIKNFPECYVNKDDYLKIIKYIYDKGELGKDNITFGVIKEITKLNRLTNCLSIDDIYRHLFGEQFYLYPYRYQKYAFREIKLTDDIAIKIFDNYLNEFSIDTSTHLLLDYESYCKEAKLRKFTSGRTLEFAVKYNKYKYAGYMFKTSSGNYYKKESNLLFDLKYLVEKDMKIETDKIPLYITKNVLLNKANPLYNYIVSNGNGSLFYWFDRLYPNKFIETDFDINAYRLEFDSDTEAFIHDILKEKFKNRLIYNQRNGEREIRVNGMSPDWFIFTDSGVWIVEYFGMFNWKTRKNSRNRNYIRKTINKLRRYRDVTGYNKLYLYLEDTYNDYSGIVEKIKVIEDELG